MMMQMITVGTPLRRRGTNTIVASCGDKVALVSRHGSTKTVYARKHGFVDVDPDDSEEQSNGSMAEWPIASVC